MAILYVPLDHLAIGTTRKQEGCPFGEGQRVHRAHMRVLPAKSPADASHSQVPQGNAALGIAQSHSTFTTNARSVAWRAMSGVAAGAHTATTSGRQGTLSPTLLAATAALPTSELCVVVQNRLLARRWKLGRRISR